MKRDRKGESAEEGRNKKCVRERDRERERERERGRERKREGEKIEI